MVHIGNFNPDEHESGSFEALEAGWYPVMCVATEKHETKAQTGAYLQFEFEVIGDAHPYRGRKLWDRLHLWNANEKAVAIAYRVLADICRATGVKASSDLDSSAFHGKALAVEIKVVPASAGYDVRNEITAYDAGALAWFIDVVHRLAR